jgi:hypothetical protein
MEGSLSIRPAARRDLHQLAAMMVELHRHLDLPPSPATPALLEAQLFAPAPPFACLVAERRRETEPAGEAGRALLAELSRLAVDQGRVSIWWGVHRTNLRAIGFYDRIGAGDFQVDLRELETEAMQALAAEAGGAA